ncbi:beta-1,3-galactosyltransferase 1-like [Clinocottus analis]|uniref:beta-1,3-galactosyltransferase 1-like n=1 Tax=Clinocottus analis TaxID=304258 RepID=UPI0035BFEB8D
MIIREKTLLKLKLSRRSEVPPCRKMLESAFCRCEKTTWTRVKRRLRFLMLLLTLGLFLFTFYASSLDMSWRLTAGHNTINTSVPDVSADAPVVYVVAYPNQYSIIVDEPLRCGQEKPFLVLMIPVAPDDRKARDTIRDTWGKETTVLGREVSHYFLLGMNKGEHGTGNINEQVLEESRKHHDVLQSDFLDSYNNLTIKTMVMFEWLSSRCPNASYAMKIDSDIFLNVRNLVNVLLTAPRREYLSGLVVRDSPVLRDQTSKWFLPFSVFPESYFPTYAQGLGYVFSLDLPKRILEASAHVKAVYIEDVYVGMCMMHLGIALTDPPHGDLFRGEMHHEPSGCYWTSVITTILENSDHLSRVWSVYQSQNGC